MLSPKICVASSLITAMLSTQESAWLLENPLGAGIVVLAIEHLTSKKHSVAIPT